MDSVRWNRLQDIIDGALDLELTERAEHLERVCSRSDGSLDAELLDEARSLLNAYEQAEVTGAIVNPFSDAAPEAVLPFSRIGAWQIERELGLGGMGAVYLATRADGAFEKSAALKVLHPGFGASFHARFELERSVLARLDHPGIARLIDGGLTPDGRPYVVMELAEGDPITEYAASRSLPIRDRLELLAQACDAVDFAHRAAVVHRDLKPAHILVHDADGLPRVKLLDFGVAKLLDAASDPALTVVAPSPATPQYAAPEQLTDDVITTATDVYALGVILYELVAGDKPYDVSGLTYSSRRRLVLDDVPRRPSDRIQDAGLKRALRGDVDQIVLKALSKDPAERYGTARDLGDDIRRHLSRRPVVARRPSSAYRMRRFVARHRVGMAATLLLFLTAGFGLSGVLWQAGIAAEERDRAERRFELAREQAQALLYDVDDLLAPITGTTRAREALIDRSLEYLSRLSAEAQDDAPLRLDIATAYMRAGSLLGDPAGPNLGRIEDAVSSYRAGIEVLPSMAMLPPDLKARRLEVEGRLQERLAEAAAFSGHVDSAIVLLHGARALYTDQAQHGEDEAARQSIGLVHLRLGDFLGNPNFPNLAEPVLAEAHYDSSLSIVQGLYADADRNTWRSLGLVHERRGTLRRASGDLNGALADFEASRDIRARLGQDDPHNYDAQRDLGIAHEKLALAYREMGRTDEALAEIRRSVAMYETIARSDSANVQSWQTLALGFLHMGDIVGLDRSRSLEAAALYREGLRVLEAHADPQNPRTQRLIEFLSRRL